MVIRPAIDADIPSIVALLKLSLGEGLMPKSEEFWRWKHVDNPFGASPVLVAEESGELIGVRAFMRWKWVMNGETYSALRAVDTATHPGHQGKGIFKKLTIQLVVNSEEAGGHFIFNTPNDKSMPGYLKMGWDNLGKTAIRIRPSAGLLGGGLKNSSHRIELDWSNPRLHALIESHRGSLSTSICTSLSAEYLRWRYELVPVADYYAVHDANFSFLIIYRLKKGKLGTELRITDFMIDQGKLDMGEFKKVWKEMLRENRPAYVSISGYQLPKVQRLLSSLLFLPAFSIGPSLTARSLNIEPGFAFWNKPSRMTSIGDLELF